MIGNINQTKNYLEFIKFLLNIKKEIKINIIGEKLENQKEYYYKIKKLKTPKSLKIYFLGRKNKPFIKKILNKSDIFCLPSLSEGTPIVLLEAMSMQSICLVSKESNLSKIIQNNKNGFEFSLNKKSFFMTLNKTLSLNYTQQKKIRKKARSTVNKINKIFKL